MYMHLTLYGYFHKAFKDSELYASESVCTANYFQIPTDPFPIIDFAHFVDK